MKRTMLLIVVNHLRIGRHVMMFQAKSYTLADPNDVKYQIPLMGYG